MAAGLPRCPTRKQRCAGCANGQAEDAAIDASLDLLDASAAADTVATRLEAAGFGKRTRSTAADVLDRLRKRAAASPVSAV
jgi:hypothetical protein